MSLIVRVEAGPQTGMGHLMRCLAISKWVRDAGTRTVFVMGRAPVEAEQLVREVHGHELRTINTASGCLEDADELLRIARDSSGTVLLDGYDFGDEYEAALASAGLRVAVMDDYGHAVHARAEIIVNGNLHYCSRVQYPRADGRVRLLLGPEYTPLRHEVVALRSKLDSGRPVRRVLLTLGGGAVHDRTCEVLKVLQGCLPPEIEICVAPGLLQHPANGSARTVRASAVRWLKDGRELPSVMAQTDLAVSAGGMASYELAYLGIPAILLAVTPAQEPVCAELETRGAAVNLGGGIESRVTALAEAVTSLVGSSDRRREMSACARAIFDGMGARRIADELVRAAA